VSSLPKTPFSRKYLFINLKNFTKRFRFIVKLLLFNLLILIKSLSKYSLSKISIICLSRLQKSILLKLSIFVVTNFALAEKFILKKGSDARLFRDLCGPKGSGDNTNPSLIIWPPLLFANSSHVYLIFE